MLSLRSRAKGGNRRDSVVEPTLLPALDRLVVATILADSAPKCPLRNVPVYSKALMSGDASADEVALPGEVDKAGNETVDAALVSVLGAIAAGLADRSVGDPKSRGETEAR